MLIRDYVQRELVDLEEGTPILLRTQTQEIEYFELDDPKGNEPRNYLMRWGGMQEGKFDGFSKGGECAYPYVLGEIFRLDHLAEAWSNKPILVPVRTVDDKGLSYMILNRIPEEVAIGKEKILSSLEKNGLVDYKPLLEELL